MAFCCVCGVFGGGELMLYIFWRSLYGGREGLVMLAISKYVLA